MMWRRYVKRWERFQTNRTAEFDALSLGGFLAVGLTFVVPLLTLTTSVPTVVWVVLVGIAYATTAVLLDRLTVGIYVALLVTMTFAANVPLASNDYLLSMTRDLGPSLWLSHLPLVALLVVLFVRDREQFCRLSRAEILLGAFVGWIVIAALVTRPLRVDAALYFALFVFWGGLIFAAVRRSHRLLPVSQKTTLGVVAGVITVKSCFALVESVRGGSFGLTRLGELSPEFAATIATLSVGSFSLGVGTYVSGFSGMSFLLASVVVLSLPFVVSRTLERYTRFRLAGVVGGVVMVSALRLTGTDAGRGAALLALGLLFMWVGFNWWSTSTIQTDRTLACVALVTVCVGVVLFPSTQAGAAGSTASTAVGSAAASAASSRVSVPLFDLSNLGIRLQQYVAGVSLFLDHPIAGIGGANFPYVADAYGIPNNYPIHNVYIALLAETGLVGFVLYTGFLLTVLGRGVRAVSTGVGDRDVRVAALAGIVGYLGFMVWDHMLFTSVVSSFTFYAVCAVVVDFGAD